MVEVSILGSHSSYKLWIVGESSYRAVVHSYFFLFFAMCFVNRPSDVIVFIHLYGCTEHLFNNMYSP